MKNLLQEYTLHSKLYSPNQNLKKTPPFLTDQQRNGRKSPNMLDPISFALFFSTMSEVSLQILIVFGQNTQSNCSFTDQVTAIVLEKNKGMKSFKTSQPFISTVRKKSHGVNTGTQREIQEGGALFYDRVLNF